MRKHHIFSACLFIISIAFASSFTASKKELKSKNIVNQEEYKLVNSAILDYVEGLYLVDSTRIDKSVDKKLRKIGFWYNADKKQYVDNLEMTHTQLSNLAARWNKNGNRVHKNSPKEIEIFDINSKTASAKLTAEWGIDLFHLAKVNNQWKIVNVIWQSQPKEE
jgi:hypothetical protein